MTVDIVKDTCFCHNAFDVVVNPNAVIERGTTIQHGVIIRKLNSHEAPIIKDH